MKCKKQPPYKIPEPIANVWEVIFSNDTWDKILTAKTKSKSTYSWVVRYCVFKLLDSEKKGKISLEVEGNVQSCTRKTGHRMQLCLYGEDEKYLRAVALRLGVSISHLLRVSVANFIDDFFEKERQITRKTLVKVATKLFKTVSYTLIKNTTAKKELFNFIFYDKKREPIAA